MDSSKLKDALKDLQTQRAILDNAISGLQKVISTMNGHESKWIVPGEISSKKPTPTYLDVAVDRLTRHGKPMSIKDITYYISNERGKVISRNSVQATFSRHISNSKHPRLVKVGPGVFALPDWPQQIKDQWTEIVNQ